MTSKQAVVSILSLALLLAACSTTSAGPSGSATASTSVAPVSLPPSNGPTASLAATPAASPTPGDIDPCTLLTAAEASTLMGKTLSAGVSTTLDPDRECAFRSGVTEVKLILAPPAIDSKTAQDDWDAEQAQIPAGVTMTDPKLFDRSAFFTGSAEGQSLSALFVIDGTNFFDLFCGFPACTQTASTAAAQLIAGRLP